MRISFARFFPFQISSLLGLAAACLLLFGSGCASKTTTPPVSGAFPSAPDLHSPVTDILLARFEAWEGVPHRTGGQDRAGIDCSGLVQIVFREAFGLELPRTSREQSLAGEGVDASDMRPGDLVYFAEKAGGHVGVVVDAERFLHASATVGVTVSEFDGYWLPRLVRVRRILPPSLTSPASGS
jgi:cell wall-associated NlpC family hydrolase